jgi:hypothetical protein
MVVAVVFLKLFDRHAEPARGLPQVGTLLHQPGRRRVTQGVADDILVKPCIPQDAFPRRAYLAGQRLAVMRAVDDKANLLAVLHQVSLVQFSRALHVQSAPTHEVRPQPGGDLRRRPPLFGARLRSATAEIDQKTRKETVCCAI